MPVLAHLIVPPCLSIALVLSSAATSAEKRPGKRQWRVWYTTCPVYAGLPGKDDKPVETLKENAVIDGARYFKVVGEAEWIAFKADDGLRYAPFAYLTHVPAENRVKGDLPIGKERVDRWNGLPHDYVPSDLQAVPSRYCWNDVEYRLRPEALKALKIMLDAAKEEERLAIRVVSAYRSAKWQRTTFLRQLKKHGRGQRISAKPGHSEHQLGATVDLTGSDPKKVLNAAFADTPEAKWLETNCHRFGFRISYTKANEKETGYIPESWHLRYVGVENLTPPEQSDKETTH